MFVSELWGSNAWSHIVSNLSLLRDNEIFGISTSEVLHLICVLCHWLCFTSLQFIILLTKTIAITLAVNARSLINIIISLDTL